MARHLGYRGWTARAVLLLAGAAMLASGVGWNEPALAAGPRFDPPLLPGLDQSYIQSVMACLNWLGVYQHCSFFRW